MNAYFSAAGQTYDLWLLGHSMGGLVARAAIEQPSGRNAPWFDKIQALITLGTPHFGTPIALSVILDVYTPLQQDAVSTEMRAVLQAFANYSRSGKVIYDSTYQLLPPPQAATVLPNFVIVQTLGNQSQQTIFELASDVPGISQENLAGAVTFFQSLDYSLPDGLPDYYCAYGTGYPTTTGFIYDTAGSTWTPTVDPPLAGDLLVPPSSANFNNQCAKQHDFPLMNHFALAKDPGVLQYIAEHWMKLKS